MKDKCPTCPKYGTGQYCDCGSSKEKFGIIEALILGFIVSMIALVVWKVIELIINK